MSTKLTVDQVDAGDFKEIIKIGGTATTKGKLYYLTDSGGDPTWAQANATDKNAGGDRLLGVALGTNSTSDGMLLRGRADITLVGSASPGIVYYMNAANGEFNVAAPNASGNVVRVLGFCVDNAGDVYFNPSRDWIEL